MTPQSDIVRMQMTFKDGELDGDLVVNDPNGKAPFITVTFSNGMPDGEQKVCSPETHKLVYVNHWEGGVATVKRRATTRIPETDTCTRRA
ncbi:hypothetical protein [Paraburkholderia sp. MM6662-R1]|uniref:hypothetical protein n=1 Tax=Paraburkholderia sp. MM6662-R1 TaxID=2991066 RepID=UPI003D1B7D63